MSKLDKEKVLNDFSAAYKKAEGKEPDIQESNGWYSVNESTGMRLAKLDEWRQQLESGKKKTSKKSSSSGATAKELWRERLNQQAGDSRLPRGF